jgi:hypothetical protein
MELHQPTEQRYLQPGKNTSIHQAQRKKTTSKLQLE